ncbi:DUF885 domain-containing protein [Candidatus Protochlamydia phocaeensis]|uniref:DUF885 domain-containing protein n=1 Tax=Candidatus Protochlamydia phocaeensis TaxID=1414722 RepID=UPI00083857BC|nr:DUF885 domain-containing protein [Candidatus Protochlamydia phocaeensis]
MNALKKNLLMAFVFLSSFVSPFSQAEEAASPLSFEWRLQQIANESEETTRLHCLFELYWEWRMSENPDEATYLGYPGKQDCWPDLSFESLERHQRFAIQLLSALNSFSAAALSEEDAVSHQILKQLLTEEVEEFQFNNHYLLVNQMHGIHLNIALIMDLMPAATEKDYENIIARLNQIPPYLQQATALLNEGLKAGITPPRIALRHIPQQLLNQMADEALDSPFLKSFKHLPPSISHSNQRRLLTQAEDAYYNEVLPALKDFYSYLVETYIPNCRKSIAFTALPNGQEWYAAKARRSTTTHLSPQQIHEIGLKEVERIHQEMLAVMASAGFEGRFADFLHFLESDPQFFYSNREELLKGYQQLTRHIESKLPSLFTKLPSLPFEVVPVPAYSEESQIAAYYCHGSPIHERPGYFFINTSYPEKRPKWEMEPLALHEAVPGHHLQITLAQELSHLPEFRKNCHFTAYIEGWGLYAESLGIDLGLYQDSYSKFGRLTYEMLRAIRLVVDTGMHAMGWSREDAIQFFKQYVGMSDHEIITEVDRYLVMPGQALAYKIGELKIQEMRQEAIAKLGEKFDIRAFHDEWLRHGTVPLDIAEQSINQWIRQQMKAAE